MKGKSINLSKDLTRSELTYAGYVITDKPVFKTKFGDVKDCMEVSINGNKAFVYKTEEAYKE